MPPHNSYFVKEHENKKYDKYFEIDKSTIVVWYNSRFGLGDVIGPPRWSGLREILGHEKWHVGVIV